MAPRCEPEALRPDSPTSIEDPESASDGDHLLSTARSSDSLLTPRQQHICLRPAFLSLAMLMALVLAGVQGHRAGMHGPHDSGAVRESVSLAEPETVGALKDVLKSMSKGIHSVADVTDQVSSSYSRLEHMYGRLRNGSHAMHEAGTMLEHAITRPSRMREKLREEFWSLTEAKKAKIKERLRKKFNITTWKHLRPPHNLHDNNSCADDEEMYVGLCYKRCALLTNGSHPVRISAWSCCFHEPPCTMALRTHGGPCTGFGVSGDSSGNGCPHSPGSCLQNEEMWDNVCYQRCNLLTFGVLEHRAGPTLCCKAKGRFAFLQDVCDSGPEYNQGGGRDDEDALTPASPHPPMTALTEQI